MIIIRDLKKQYPDTDRPVFDGFNLQVENGEFILLTGKSGSGKTTLIRMLLKEIEPDAGELIVGQYRLSEIPAGRIPFYRREIGVVFQDFRLFEDKTVYGNLELVMAMTGGRRRDAEKRITSILAMLGIDRLHKRYPRELSGGEQQKVCMARALINQPTLLLADEPTGNLDPASSAEIMRLMELVHRQGISVIMATHDLPTANSLIHSARRVDLDQTAPPSAAEGTGAAGRAVEGSAAGSADAPGTELSTMGNAAGSGIAGTAGTASAEGSGSTERPVSS